MNAPSERSWTVLRETSFLCYAASRLFSGAGMMMIRAALTWQVYDLTGSAFYLGLVGVAQFVPSLLFSLFGGAAADAFDRKRMMIACQVLAGAGVAGVLALSLAGQLVVGFLFVLAVVISIAAAFENPARSALLPRVVSKERFQAAVTVHSALQTFAFLTGPVLMGFVVAAGGIDAVFGLYVVLIAVSLLLLGGVHPRASDEKPRPFDLRSIREGLSYVISQPVVLGAMSLDMLAVLFGGAVALLPIYATDILAVGPRGYGILMSGLEIGAVLMAGALLLMPQIRGAGRALIFSVVVFGLATIVFGLSRSFPLSLAAYAVAGAADYISVVMRQTAIQLTTPDALRGRVSSVNMIFIGASNHLGAAESGFVAELTSPTFSVVLGGVLAIVVALVIYRFNRALREYRVG